MTETSYPPEFVAYLEMQWGIGFLSPGGPEEVREILGGIVVAGKKLLDIGCGTGGPDIVIARDLAPERLIGIDIEPFLIQTGWKNIVDAGLNEVVDLKLVEAGPLPFEDQSFDIVFSKDALVHIEDKASLYREVLRVLKPGGAFAASDWLRSADADDLAGYTAWRAMTPHSFSMQTAEETIREMHGAGLGNVRTRDRAAWYAATAAVELEMMKSDPWRDQFVAAFGQDGYEQKLALRMANARAAECGGLRPTHLFGARIA